MREIITWKEETGWQISTVQILEKFDAAIAIQAGLAGRRQSRQRRTRRLDRAGSAHRGSRRLVGIVTGSDAMLDQLDRLRWRFTKTAGSAGAPCPEAHNDGDLTAHDVARRPLSLTDAECHAIEIDRSPHHDSAVTLGFQREGQRYRCLDVA
jgi:hypothetical protein